MHQSPFEHMSAYQAIDPADLGDGATNGQSIDMQGFTSIDYVLSIGAQGAGGTADMKVQDSADNSSFADLTGAALTQVADTGDNKIYILSVWRPTRRYVRPVVTIAGVGVAVIASVIGVRYGVAGTKPITQHADVGELKKVALN